jgi:Fe-S cluster assembly ATP-binding protein
MTLEIKDLYVNIGEKEILKGVNLTFEKGKIHALMGPNGSGKSTLANVIMGHPRYKITKGEIIFNGEVINELGPDERAKLGLFLSFQYPSEVEGVTIAGFLRTAYNSRNEGNVNPKDFQELLKEKMELLSIDPKFAFRYLNHGFSGGEKKKSEILQLSVLNPSACILDETDSGLDIDALREVSKGVKKVMDDKKIVVVITHYKRILEYLNPDKLSILIDGKVALEGGGELVDQLEEKGYSWIMDNDSPDEEKH